MTISSICYPSCNKTCIQIYNGWSMVGQWLANGWPTVGECTLGEWLANAWPMPGERLACKWSSMQWLANCWIINLSLMRSESFLLTSVWIICRIYIERIDNLALTQAAISSSLSDHCRHVSQKKTHTKFWKLSTYCEHARSKKR